MLIRLFIISTLLLMTSPVFSQYRYQVVKDSVRHIFSIFAIDDRTKTFRITDIRDCVKLKFFMKDAVMVYWDTKKYIHFVDIRKGLVYAEAPVVLSYKIADITSMELTKDSSSFTRNGEPSIETLYLVKFMTFDGKKCEMKLDRAWFGKLYSSCDI
jgi:hypothetical protein